MPFRHDFDVYRARPGAPHSKSLSRRSFDLPKCGGRLRILGFIDNPSVIEKILRHLKLWDLPDRSPPSGCSITMESDADFLNWEAAARLFDAID
jgi:hypothetical protein